MTAPFPLEGQYTAYARFTCTNMKATIINTMQQMITLEKADSNILVKDVKLVDPGRVQFTTVSDWSVENDLVYRDRGTFQNNMASVVQLMALLNAHVVSHICTARPAHGYTSLEVFESDDVDKCVSFCKDVCMDNVTELARMVNEARTTVVQGYSD